jgi:hypothetical protein
VRQRVSRAAADCEDGCARADSTTDQCVVKNHASDGRGDPLVVEDIPEAEGYPESRGDCVTQPSIGPPGKMGWRSYAGKTPQNAPQL